MRGQDEQKMRISCNYPAITSSRRIRTPRNPLVWRSAVGSRRPSQPFLAQSSTAMSYADELQAPGLRPDPDQGRLGTKSATAFFGSAPALVDAKHGKLGGPIANWDMVYWCLLFDNIGFTALLADKGMRRAFHSRPVPFWDQPLQQGNPHANPWPRISLVSLPPERLRWSTVSCQMLRMSRCWKLRRMGQFRSCQLWVTLLKNLWTSIKVSQSCICH